jgi:hypothetical protein
MTNYYIVVRSTNPEIDHIIADCTAKTEQFDPDGVLSVSFMNDGTELIKLPNTDASWIDEQTWADSVIVAFTSEQDSDRLAYYNSRVGVGGDGESDGDPIHQD